MNEALRHSLLVLAQALVEFAAYCRYSIAHIYYQVERDISSPIMADHPPSFRRWWFLVAE
jgi:hypothetical protein